jgi:hypothetical protein
VEHLLRNVKDATISTLASDVSAKLQALKGLKGRLADVQEYLGAVLEGRLPVNNDIMTYLQVCMDSCYGASVFVESQATHCHNVLCSANLRLVAVSVSC